MAFKVFTRKPIVSYIYMFNPTSVIRDSENEIVIWLILMYYFIHLVQHLTFSPSENSHRHTQGKRDTNETI